jgi:hypothetical protein
VYNVHNDGWNVYGELSPDYFILFCSEPAAPEGEGDSWMLDGYQIMDAMTDDSREAMFTQPMVSKDPTTRQISPLHGGDMWAAEWQAPIAQALPDNGRVLCRMAGRDLDVPARPGERSHPQRVERDGPAPRGHHAAFQAAARPGARHG